MKKKEIIEFLKKKRAEMLDRHLDIMDALNKLNKKGKNDSKENRTN